MMTDKTDGKFSIQGQIRLEEHESIPGELNLMAYAFGIGGEALAMVPVGDKGEFSLELNLAQPANIELMVGPKDNPKSVRRSSVFKRRYSIDDWKHGELGFVLTPDLRLPKDLWWPWWPRRVCVSGRVRKLVHRGAMTDQCPVPFVKVEVFDVDRENFWWPP